MQQIWNRLDPQINNEIEFCWLLAGSSSGQMMKANLESLLPPSPRKSRRGRASNSVSLPTAMRVPQLQTAISRQGGPSSHVHGMSPSHLCVVRSAYAPLHIKRCSMGGTGQ